MAGKQIEWKQEVNRDSGKWWLRALVGGGLCVLLAWGSLSLAGTVLGMRELSGSVKFLLFAGVICMGAGFLQEWQGRREGIGRSSGKSKIRRCLELAGLFVGAALLLWLVYRDGGEVWFDLQTVGETYLHRLSIQSPNYRLKWSETEALHQALEFGCLVLLLFFQVLGSMLRSRKVLLAMPICVVCAGLLAMAVPDWKDVALVFISGMLLIYLENSVRISWKRFAALGAGLVLLLSVAGRYEEDAQDEMLAMNEDWFEYWGDLGETIGEKLENFEMPQFNVDKDVIDNRPPEFAEKPVLTITMEKKPQGTLYLRGYHCADYEDSEWKKDTASFAKACREYGIEEEDATERLMENQYELEEKVGSQALSYEISYTKYCNEYAYLPYGAGWEELSDEYELSGDYVVTGDHEEEFSVTGWQSLSFQEGLMEATGDYSRFRDWYNDFVLENYLSVPGELDEVEDLAEELSEDARLSSYLAYITVENHTPETVNYYRLQLALGVAEYLKREGSYSLELDKLPAGEDAVEYFLENGMEGFCEHFASAGTLLLRELGVPARYVGGYIVKQGDMSREDDGYEATVMDSAAHAWTEIYLENYGWVPIEMTPGYGGMVDIPEATAAPEDEPTEAPASPPEEEATIPPEGEPTEAPQEPTEAPDKAPGVDSEGKDGEDADDEEGSGDEDGSEDSWKDSDREGSVWGKLLIGLLLAAVVAGGGMVAYRYLQGSKRHGIKRLTGYMQRGENRNAIRWINKLMYERLVEKEGKKIRYSDAEYLEALKRLYPDMEEARWEAYFALVRKAVYSREQISSEGVNMCYEVYKAVVNAKEA